MTPDLLIPRASAKRPIVTLSSPSMEARSAAALSTRSWVSSAAWAEARPGMSWDLSERSDGIDVRTIVRLTILP